MKIVFMGTPEFGIMTLEYLYRFCEVLVVTRPDKKVGRKQILKPTPVKDWAVLHGVRYLQPPRVIEAYEEIKEFNPDLIITAAFGEFIPSKILDLARIIAINIHASLLPKYRGGAPIHKAIMNGEQETGVTVIRMVKKMDAGEILAQKKVAIAFNETASSLFGRLSVVARDLMIELFPLLEKRMYTLTPQDESLVTFAYNITHEEQWIDWSKTATEIACCIRGLTDQPGALTAFEGVGFRFTNPIVLSDLTPVEPGTIISCDKELVIKAGKNAIKIGNIQQAGKKMLSAKEFLNGNKILLLGKKMQMRYEDDALK